MKELEQHESKKQGQPGQWKYFSVETLQSLKELGVVLKEIHRDMIAAGYVMKDGRVVKVGNKKSDNGKHTHNRHNTQ